MYLEIGQTAVIDGKKIKCVVSNTSHAKTCNDCIYDLGKVCGKESLQCSFISRPDKQNAHFILDETT